MDQASPIFNKAYTDASAKAADPDGSKAKKQKEFLKQGKGFNKRAPGEDPAAEKRDAQMKALEDAGMA